MNYVDREQCLRAQNDIRAEMKSDRRELYHQIEGLIRPMHSDIKDIKYRLNEMEKRQYDLQKRMSRNGNGKKPSAIRGDNKIMLDVRTRWGKVVFGVSTTTLIAIITWLIAKVLGGV